MAYVGNTARIFDAITHDDLETVQSWLSKEDVDPNRRDYTGRTPLHLAVMISTPEIVQCLVDHGARLVSRIADGRTALHLAAARGSREIVKILLTKSEENEEIEEAKKDRSSPKEEDEDAHMSDAGEKSADEEDVDDISMISGDTDDKMSLVTGSFVHVKKDEENDEKQEFDEENTDEPDVYDINVLAWDTGASPLHLAIVHNNIDVVEELVSSFGADVLLPIKLYDGWKYPQGAILPLALALALSPERAVPMVETLLRLGVTSAQADISGMTSLHYFAPSLNEQLFDTFMKHDEPAFKRATSHIAVGDRVYSPTADSPLSVAVKARNPVGVMKLLEEAGATSSLNFSDFLRSAKREWRDRIKEQSSEETLRYFNQHVDQPVIMATLMDQPLVAQTLLNHGANPNTLTHEAHRKLDTERYTSDNLGNSLLDIVNTKIRQLGGYKGEKINTEPPSPLKDDQVYLGSYQDETYQMFFAKMELQQEKRYFKRRQNNYTNEVEQAQGCTGLDEKKRAVKALMRDFETLKTTLLEKGAKTFKELHPGMRKAKRSHNHWTRDPFEIKFKFEARNLTDAKRAGYLKLYVFVSVHSFFMMH